MYTSNSCGESSVHYLWYIYIHTLLIICGSLSYRYVHVYIYIQYTCDILTYIYIYLHITISIQYISEISYIYMYIQYYIVIGFILDLYHIYTITTSIQYACICHFLMYLESDTFPPRSLSVPSFQEDHLRIWDQPRWRCDSQAIRYWMGKCG